jgi:hypothetical protein
VNHGIADPAGLKQWAVEQSDPATWDAPDDDPPDDPPDITTDATDPDAESQSGWGAVAKGVLALGLVSELLMASVISRQR